MNPDLDALLRTVRRRIRMAWTVDAIERFVPVAAVVAAALVAASRMVPWAWTVPAALIVAVGTAMAVVGRGISLPVSDAAAARSADRALATHDAFSTALQFAGTPGPFGAAIAARAEAAARRADPVDAIPVRPHGKPIAVAAVAAIAALALVAFTDAKEPGVDPDAAVRAQLADEADSLDERAEALRADPAASPDRLTLADELEALAEELRSADDLDTALEAIDRTRSELEVGVGDAFLAEKAAARGLDQALAAQPLSPAGGSAADQLDRLADEVRDLDPADREAVAARLESLAATQRAGNSAAAAALGEAADALAAGDLAAAAGALGEASDAQGAGLQSVADQQARLDASDALDDAAGRAGAAADGQGNGQGSGQGNGDGDGSGQGNGQGSGQGNGSGSGSGQGNGSGSPSGAVGGASGGTGSGQGGQGTANGSGSSTETGDADAPTVWLPGGDSDEQFVGGSSTSSETTGTVGQGNGPTTTSGARVPIDTIVDDFRSQAIEGIDRGRIPPSARELVQRYFDQIAGL